MLRSIMEKVDNIQKQISKFSRDMDALKKKKRIKKQC